MLSLSRPVNCINEDSIFSSKRVFSLSAPENPMCQILGKLFYSGSHTSPTQESTLHSLLQQELHSIMYFPCRKDMKSLEYLGKTVGSDLEWGCCLRVVQMMVANCLKRHMFERQVQCFSLSSSTYSQYQSLINMFVESRSLDDMSHSPFGIHSLLTQAINLFDAPPKQGYSLYQSSKAFKKQFKNQQFVQTLKFITSSSPIIFKDDLKNKMKEWKKSLLIVLHVNSDQKEQVLSETRIEQLKQMMDLEYFVGAGTYIKQNPVFSIGYMNRQFLSLDPSNVKSACKNPLEMTQEESNTFFARTVRADSMEKFGSSFSIAFYIRTENQFKIFIQSIENLIEQYSESEEQFPIQMQNTQFDIALSRQSSSQAAIIDLN